jgi:hypothetical protein
MSRAFVREENETADDRADFELEKMKESGCNPERNSFFQTEPKTSTMIRRNGTNGFARSLRYRENAVETGTTRREER